MNEEYRAIVDAGFLLQIDDPRLITHYNRDPALSIAECRKFIALRVEILNHALRGIPEDRVRFHTCYSVNVGPRVHDLELKHYVDLMLKIHAQAYSIEASNPRHEHEWQVWEVVKLAAGQNPDPGRGVTLCVSGRASRAGGAAHRTICAGRRQAQRDRRQRLRIRDLRGGR